MLKLYGDGTKKGCVGWTLGKGHYQRPSNLEISCVQVVILRGGEISKPPTTMYSKSLLPAWWL